MSFTSALDDFMSIKKKQGKNKLSYNPPLSQGKTYLNDRSKMCHQLSGNLKLIEGFQDQTGVNKNVVAGLTHATDTYDKDFIQPVIDENKSELQQLEEMQQSYDATQTAWAQQFQHVMTLAKGQPAEIKNCLENCKSKKGTDLISSCMLGCNTGHFASKGPTSRATENPGGPPAWAFLADAAMATDPALLAGGVVASVAEGFTVGAPATAGGGQPDTGSRVMGTYGPTGFGKPENGRQIGGQAVNTLLASNPVKGDFNLLKQFNNTHGWNFTKGDPHEDNPNGLFAIQKNAMASAAANLSSQLGDSPLVQQMANTNVGAANIGPYLDKMEDSWKNVFKKSCQIGIGGFGQVQTGDTSVNSGPFAGHTQYCTSWVNTAEGRSGYYDQKAGKTAYSVDSSGNQKPFIVGNIPLANQPPSGCDTVIPASRSSDSKIGGSGYCICSDGTKKGYADKGHGSFTCNQVCASLNKDVAGSGPLYHNTANWTPQSSGKPLAYNPSSAAATKPPYLFTGSMPAGSAGGQGSQPPNCPNGMTGGEPYHYKSKNNKKMCRTWFLDGGWKNVPPDSKGSCGGIFTITKGLQTVPPSVQLARKCALTKPPGYDKAMVDNLSTYKKLPTQSELLQSCSGQEGFTSASPSAGSDSADASGGSGGDPPYQNIYIDILKLKVLGLVLQQKGAIIYKAVAEAYGGSKAAALKSTASGQSILKNMSKYRDAYQQLRSQKNKKLLTSGMYEDVRLKKKSVDISYLIWFALAISGTALVIKKLNN